MQKFLRLAILGFALFYAPTVLAAEWIEVVENSVGDKFYVDKSTMQRNGNNVWYWEYREFEQPNNAFLEVELDEPVYGATIYRSVDCTSRVARLRQLLAHDKDKNVIRRFDYGNEGTLSQSRSGSSSAEVLSYVCSEQNQ